MSKSSISEEEFLKNYSSSEYERPSVTTDIIVFTVTDRKSDDIRKLDTKELKVLLIKRKDHPFIDKWALPGGFVHIDESLDDAAKRKLSEETYIDNIYMEQLYTYGGVDRDPRMRVISVAYISLLSSKSLKKKEFEDKEIQWFTVNRKPIEDTEEENKWLLELKNDYTNTNINYIVTEKKIRKGLSIEYNTEVNIVSDSGDKLAFDHQKIIVDALKRLENKIEYTSIAFNLLNEYFTRAEIQGVYELLLNRKLSRTELWRKINKMVIETDKVKSEKGYRPSKYYKFNKSWVHKF